MRKLWLKKNEDRRVRAGHLWIFANEVDVKQSPLTDFAPGEAATLCDWRGAPLGSVCVNPASLICARLHSRRPDTELDEPLLAQRLQSALSLRQRLYPGPWYRLCHGEGDFLPGLVIDRYGDHLTVQVTTAGMAEPLLRAGVKVVDLSADFRLRDPETYAAWYKREHVCSDLLHKAVYGLPELYAAEVAKAKLIANPGCYPTSVILGLYAAIKNDLVCTDDIVVDAKSGATGAGRKAVVPTLFCEVSDNFRAYGLPTHRHTPEIEQEVSLLAGHGGRADRNV